MNFESNGDKFFEIGYKIRNSREFKYHMARLLGLTVTVLFLGEFFGSAADFNMMSAFVAWGTELAIESIYYDDFWESG